MAMLYRNFETQAQIDAQYNPAVPPIAPVVVFLHGGYWRALAWTTAGQLSNTST